MNWTPKWPSLGILIFVIIELGIAKGMFRKEERSRILEIVGPPSHIVLSGDVTISLIKRTNKQINVDALNVERNDRFTLRVLYFLDDISELIGTVPFDNLPTTEKNTTIVIPCGFFSRGGIYILQFQYKNVEVPVQYTTVSEFTDIAVRTILDVKWPKPAILLDSEKLSTYPTKPLEITIKYEDVVCAPSKEVPLTVYIFQLIYCGSISMACYPKNNSQSQQVLYQEEVKGFQREKVITSGCEHFGLPGNYAVRLKASNVNPQAPITSVYIKVNWSEEYYFNVHARSIYPCEGPGGVTVLFQYPSCRLQGDRVRLYGRLRADVTSLASPSSLHYITELRSIPGKHSLTFDCELFTEKYIEYCFVYVSQAINGAMADVNMSCVPTFPFQETDAAGWGPWSPWSSCSSSCFGGIRNRYRFCDTPPPKYGAKFCQGKAVETEFCGSISPDYYNQKLWNAEELECHGGGMLAATRPEVAAEIGLHCRCGCIMTLKEEMRRRIVAANTQTCPGRSFWLLQAKFNFVIGLHLDQLRFPCPGQYFRARDGDSLNANLLIDIAFDKNFRESRTLFTTGQNLLLEFFSDELTATGDSCIGGFLAHAALLDKQYLGNQSFTVVPYEVTRKTTNGVWIAWKPAHLATASVLILIFLISIFLSLQFLVKYRKYRIAEDLDNFSDTSELVAEQSMSMSMSTTTLMSEVLMSVELPKKQAVERQVVCNVRQQCDHAESIPISYKSDASSGSSTLKLKDSVENTSEKTITSTKSNASDNLLTASSIAQPEVKFAYPVKLRTLDNGSPIIGESLAKVGEGKSQRKATVRDNISISIVQQYLAKGCTSPGILSNASSLRSGKETKDRRNRERLLQGPGSEFSLSNPDSELELDYYDYNVANASAVPGSYLGMDPAFLVWIPPISSETDTELQDLIFEPPTHKRCSILTLETEGAALTPLEYSKMKLSEELKLDLNLESHRIPKFTEEFKLDIDQDSRAHNLKGEETITPVQRIIDRSNRDPRFDNLIPNRITNKDSDRLHSPTRLSKNNTTQYEGDTVTTVGKNDEKNLKYREFIESTQNYGMNMDSVAIPMIELAGSPLKAFGTLCTVDNKDVEARILESPDYGIETCLKQDRFYDQDIRFADEEDEEEEYRDRIIA